MVEVVGDEAAVELDFVVGMSELCNLVVLLIAAAEGAACASETTAGVTDADTVDVTICVVGDAI